MLDRVIRLSIANPVFVNLLFFVVIAAGLRSAVKLPREQFPEIALDRVQVMTVYPGATAEDVEELVTRPIEDALDDVQDIDRIQSLSSEGASNVTITFLEGKDLQDARSEVEKAVSSVDNLPEDTETPIVRELALELPVISIAVLGDPGATRAIDRVEEQLRDIPGVARVNVSGLAERKIYVDVDEQKLRGLGLGARQIADAIEDARASIPAGSVERAGSDIFVKTEERLLGARDVAVIPITPGSPLKIGDVAQLSDTVEDLTTEFFVNGRPAVKLTVSREESSDPLKIRDAVIALLPQLQQTVPPGLDVVISDDFTSVIRDRLRTVAINAVGGAFLVMLVLLVMSGTRQALLALWGMPVSYLAATLLMGQVGLSLNVVSTFGLLIATGIIVDDAVVVIENVQRHLEMKKPRPQAVLDGTREVLAPVSVAVFTTMLAFMPLTMVSGVMGRALGILPKVVIFCLLGSLIEAILILPGHLAHYASKDAADSRTARLARRMQGIYRPALRWSVRHKYVVVLLALLGFVGAGGLARTMPVTIGAPGKPFELEVMYEVPPGVDKAVSVREGQAIQAVVAEHLEPHITATTLRAGSTLDRQTGLLETGANLGQLRWEFAMSSELEERYPRMIEELRRYLATNPTLGKFSVQEMQAGPPTGAAVTVRVRGRDVAVLNEAVEELKSAIWDMDGLYDVRDDYGSGKETFRVRVDQDRAALYGLTKRQVGQAVRLAVDGIVAAEVSIDEEPVEIVVRYAGGRERGKEGLGDLLVSTPRGGIVRLDQVAEIQRTREVGFVRREDGQRTVSVLAEVEGEKTTAFAAARDIQELWDGMKDRYPGFTLSFGGEADELAASLGDLPGAFALAVGLIYMVLALQFRSYVQPFIILCAVPFGMMGAVAGLFSLGLPLSMFALFGIVALAGIVVNDSLVMIDRINRVRTDGQDAREAVELGAMQRLRPIVSTTLTTCLGLLPLAVGLGGKDLILAPMAVSISAGLGVASLLVLLVVPALYLILEDVRAIPRRVRARFSRGSG